MKTKLKWKEIYKEKRNNRYYEVTGIKKENVEIESSPIKVIKKYKYYVALISLVIIAFVFYSFRNDIKIALSVIAFFILASSFFVLFNYYKLTCGKDGLYIKLGFQNAMFNYDRIKSVYISRFNDSSYLFSIRTYNIVIRYIDNFNRLKELFFDASFLNKEQALEFLNNFELKEVESEDYKQYEKLKLLKKIGKVVLIVLFIIIVGLIGYNQLSK